MVELLEEEEVVVVKGTEKVEEVDLDPLLLT